MVKEKLDGAWALPGGWADIGLTPREDISCEIVGGNLSAGIETSDARFFGSHELPELSVERNTESQIKTMFEYLEDQNKETLFD